MIATSQNGWKAAERADLSIVTVTVPGTKTKLPVLGGDVATVLLWVATRWHNEVEPLEEPGNWGYAYRPVRGATSGLSNHASGTAIDLNAPKHPLGTDPSKTMTKAQVSAAKRIEADSGGVVRWGGSYTGRKDPMHWEIDAPAVRVAALATRIRGGDPKPAPTPPPTLGDPDMRLYIDNKGSIWKATDFTLTWVGSPESAALLGRGAAPMIAVTEGELGRIRDEIEGNCAALMVSVAKAAGGDVDEQAIVAGLLPQLTGALAGKGGLTRDDVEAAVRQVFGDAATGS